MSTRSVFERQLTPGLRTIGFNIKIPDCTRAKKPFDYVLGLMTGEAMRFIAIEAKKADGWRLASGKFQPHQRRALSLVDSIDPDSAWVAIGFLDLSKMKRGPDRKKLDGEFKNEAFLIRWRDYLSIEVDGGCSYVDISSNFPQCKLTWDKPGKYTYNAWVVPKTHQIFSKKVFLA